MSRRLKLAHTPEALTDIDNGIWFRVVKRTHRRWKIRRGTQLLSRSVDADRRAADLMWSAQRARTPGVDWPPLSVIGPDGEIACGGALLRCNPVWRHRHSA